MQRRLMIVEYEDDEELSKSRKSAGKQSPLTHDRDGNLSHVVLDEVSDDDLAPYASTRPSPVDDWDDDDWNSDEDPFDRRLKEEDVEALVALLTALVEVVGPRLRDWWRNSGRTSARAARDRTVARLARHRRNHTTDVELVDAAPIRDAAEADGPTFTVDEARRILNNALAAAAYAQHQIDLIQRATIVDDGTSPALGKALRGLGPGTVADTIAMLNEADPAALNEMLLATRPAPLRAIALPIRAATQDSTE
jgi:hypothetical protein